MRSESPIIKKYKYFGKTISSIAKLCDIIDYEEYMSDEIVNSLQTIETVYVVMKSDETFLNPILNDAELYELEMIFDEFFNILLNMRETNQLKTSYLFKKLSKTCESNLSNFIKRYPKIREKYSKIDPENRSRIFWVLKEDQQNEI